MSLRTAAVASIVLLAGASEALAQGRYGYDRGGQSSGGPSVTAAGIGARYRYWQAELEGEVEADASGVPGSGVDFGDFGLDDKDTIHDVSVWFPNLPVIGQLHAQYWWTSIDGAGTSLNSFNYSGVTFAPGAVDAQTDWRCFTFLWESPLGGVLGVFQAIGLTGQVGFKYLTMDMDLSGTGLSGNRAEADAGTTAWMPIFGAAGGFNPLSFLGIQIEMNGAWLTGLFDVNGTVFDFTGTLRITVSNFYVGAGWRWIKFDIKDGSPKGADELKIDAELSGLVFEGGFRF